MTEFFAFTIIIVASLCCSLVVMALRDLFRLQKMLPKVIDDPTRRHLNPKMLDSASPLVRRLYANIYELVEVLRQSAKQQKIRSFDMQRLLDSMREGVLAVHTSGKVLYYNSAFLDLMGIKAGTLGDPIFLNAVNLPSEIEALLKESRSDLMGNESTLAIGEDSRRKYYWCKTSPLENWQREKIGILLVVNDVTTSKMDEIARREFTANVSHQLRTPLTMIKGYIETLLDEDLSESHRDYLQVVEKHSNQLQQVVDELMTLAKFNDPSVQVDLEPLSLVRIVREAQKSATDIAQKKSLQIKLATRIAGDDLVLGNGVLLSQAIFNLIENAIKFSPAGSEVRVDSSSDATHLYVRVEDHGPGIDPAEREKIFQRFYRGSETASKTRGTGLGLAIVKHIVRAHRGEIHVESPASHSGSSFVIRLPRLG